MTTNPTISVREANQGDLPSITEIYAYHVLNGTASFEIIPPGLDEMSRRWDRICERGLPYLVAGSRSGLLGYAYAGPYHARPAYRWTLENSIYVAQEARRQGVGRALLEQLLVRCTTLGYRQMVAVIGDSRNGASIGLHRRCGFVETGVLRAVGFKFGGWLDSVFMQRALGDGDATAVTLPP